MLKSWIFRVAEFLQKNTEIRYNAETNILNKNEKIDA